MIAVLVRNGRQVWPTCDNCGCRLCIESLNEESVLLYHWIGGRDDEDAVGHRCGYLKDFVMTKRENIYSGAI